MSIALQNDSLGFEPGFNGGRNNLAMLAYLRTKELVSSGKKSMLPGAPRGEELQSIMWRPQCINDREYFREEYRQLRDDADKWQSARTDFMIERLRQGLHPDTDENFWSGYVERPALQLPDFSIPVAYNAAYERKMNRIRAIVISIPVAIVMAAIIYVSWSSRRSNRARPEDRNREKGFPEPGELL